MRTFVLTAALRVPSWILKDDYWWGMKTGDGEWYWLDRRGRSVAAGEPDEVTDADATASPVAIAGQPGEE